MMSKSSKQKFEAFYEAFRSGKGPKLDARGKELKLPGFGQVRGYLRQYARWLKPHRRDIGFVFLLAVGAALVGLVQPYAPKLILDHILANESLAEQNLQKFWLFVVCILVLVALVLQVGLGLLRGYKMAVLNAKVIFRLRKRLFGHMQRLPLHRLHELKTGGIITRLSSDVDQITGLLQEAFITPTVAVMRIILTLVMLFVINWKLALTALILIPPVVLLNITWLRKVRPIYRSIRHDRSEIDGRLVETFGGIRVVRAFSQENREAIHFAEAHHTIIRKRILAQVYQLIVTAGWEMLIPLIVLITFWYGGILLLAGACTAGDIWAFQLYVLFLLHPLAQIVQAYSQTQQALASMERVFDLLGEPTDKPDRPGAIEAPQEVESLRFENVTFAYRDGEPVLRGIDFEVEAGNRVALVGPSGAGKTTVTDLVARFYDPTAGRILLNGTDLRDFQLRSYRRLLGVVQQEVFLFDGTIRENLVFGRRRATTEEMIDAAVRANADAFIRSFPDGYETLIGERGVRLSGGQRQRLSIARAMLADPAILIMDEATSSLDTESEQLIQSSLAELLAGRTTLVIAHRLSTIQHADLILVFEDGEIVERGTHAALLAKEGRYHDMVRRQSQAIRPEADVFEW
jgi:ATP-binding cassette subfamily B protein/subfamily B ATP-binding cassette protein MsbA